MEAPRKGLTRKEFEKAVDDHALAKYRADGDKFFCKTCGEKILWVTRAVSVHISDSGGLCAGEGVVKGIVERYLLPYCPKCEGIPKNKNTCIHIAQSKISSIPIRRSEHLHAVYHHGSY